MSNIDDALIEDAGEEISGAKKMLFGKKMTADLLSNMSAEEMKALVTKQAIWPTPDWDDLVNNGMPAVVAAYIKLVRDSLPVSANLNVRDMTTRLPREVIKIQSDYVTMVSAVRDALIKLNDLDFSSLSHLVMKEAGITDWSNNEQKHLYWSIVKSRTDPLHPRTDLKQKARQLVSQGFPSIQPWMKGYVIKEYKFAGKNEFYISQKGKVIKSEFSSWEQAENYLKELHNDSKSKKTNSKADGPKAPPERPYLKDITRKGHDYRNGKNITAEDFISTFGFRGVQFGNYLANDERQSVLNFAYDAFMDLADVLNVEPEFLSLDNDLGIAFGARGNHFPAHYEASERVINMSKINGAGSLAHEWGHAFDHAIGYHLTPEENLRGQIPSLTGWRDGGLGVSCLNLKKIPHTNLQNISALLDKIHKREEDFEESYQRLKNSADAREEKVRRQIEILEIEKKKQFPNKKFIKQCIDWIHSQKRSIEITRENQEKIKNGFYETKFKIKNSFFSEAMALCKGKENGYWVRANELFARSFECYVFDKLKADGRNSDYLVHSVEEDLYTDKEKYLGNPYPVGKERKEITESVCELVEVLKQQIQFNNDQKNEDIAPKM